MPVPTFPEPSGPYSAGVHHDQFRPPQGGSRTPSRALWGAARPGSRNPPPASRPPAEEVTFMWIKPQAKPRLVCCEVTAYAHRR
ncbi:hypothetical protein DEIGR_102459 [Deinococcus grandis]|uniref:Coenzyme PQQ synthesis protein A n=1 Tax=Deinococcus grandis TaxID=57498 RepID=A0A100HKN6_9DEIO|nr:hypothetical protein DEGR_07930 [Deinococcus grandis]GAQ22432.1 hypothetical protein DEIGR_102459 [Deinococcus grandis]